MQSLEEVKSSVVADLEVINLCEAVDGARRRVNFQSLWQRESENMHVYERE